MKDCEITVNCSCLVVLVIVSSTAVLKVRGITTTGCTGVAASVCLVVTQYCMERIMSGAIL